MVEALGPFQPNDARLVARGERDQLVVLTGPNMAGKSTWMRQVALIVLLAQVGSFVPAQRRGSGWSTRSSPASARWTTWPAGARPSWSRWWRRPRCCAAATDRSLVVLDEIGRGTSTHDGMAIAWAVVEHLAAGPVRPRAIVATHYHELAALRTSTPQVTLLRAAVEERAGRASASRTGSRPGAADRSFGIEVARLAGLPPAVLERARQVADAVEPLSAEVARRLGRATRPGT